MSARYAVIGNPIGHTKSPMIHSAFAAATGQDIVYTTIEGRIGAFAEQVDEFRAAGGFGLNITAPFKLDAYNYAKELKPSAALAGAVNCLNFSAGGAVGENFDGVGLVRDIVANLGVGLTGKRVLLLGAGGAARGALLPLLRQDPAELVLVNRTFSKAVALSEQFANFGTVVAASYEALSVDHAGRYDVVVNATSASLRQELPPVPASVFRSDTLAYELLYGKGLTPFLKLARDAGSMRLADGVGMLVEQAAEAFAWWRGVRPLTTDIIAKMTVPLEKRRPDGEC